jgi:hypothetical protein
MKTGIDTKALANAVPQDAVTQSAIKARDSQSSYVRKSFSLYSNEVEYVDALAVSLGQSRGKTMSASEALRVIINAHKDGKS